MGSDYYRYRARKVLEGKWGVALVAALVASLFGALIVGSNFSLSLDLDEDILKKLPEVVLTYLVIAGSIGSVLGILQFVLGGVVQLGYCKFLLNMEDGKPANFHDLFSQFNRFGEAFLMNLLRSIYVALWTLLFIIPGIVATYKYALAPFILLENPGMKANDAIRESKERMDGNKADLFMLDLSFIGWALLNVLTLGIGSFWLNPYMNASRAAFYRNLCPLPASTPDPDYGFETPTGQSYEL